eukprot:scaffold44914_cov77-Phaeocystis_antarctica.AAC.2
MGSTLCALSRATGVVTDDCPAPTIVVAPALSSARYEATPVDGSPCVSFIRDVMFSGGVTLLANSGTTLSSLRFECSIASIAEQASTDERGMSKPRKLPGPEVLPPTQVVSSAACAARVSSRSAISRRGVMLSRISATKAGNVQVLKFAKTAQNSQLLRIDR